MKKMSKENKAYNKMIEDGKTSAVYYDNRGESVLIWKDTPENDKIIKKLIAGVF